MKPHIRLHVTDDGYWDAQVSRRSRQYEGALYGRTYLFASSVEVLASLRDVWAHITR